LGECQAGRGRFGSARSSVRKPWAAESFVDSFKTELIAERVWRTRSQLELAIVEYISWFNTDRLHESLGDIPPVEFETLAALRCRALTQ
jgi:transposase InsO family protein